MQFQIFKYREANHIDDLTTVEINGDVWFVAAEVCALLDIKNVSDAVGSLDDDDRTTSLIPRGSRRVSANLVNESGLYNLIFRSKKPTAKQFKKWVTREVIPTIRKTGAYGINRATTPNFVIRYNDNWDRVEKGHFSVISELFVRLYGRFAHYGYFIPDKAFNGKQIRPDVSVGQLFPKFLEKNYPELANKYKTYVHRFPDGFEVDARQYDISLLPIFIHFVDEHWMVNSAQTYFAQRDPLALDYLPKLLPSSATGTEPRKTLPKSSTGRK